MPRSGTCKCLNCSTFFTPDPRSKGAQKYCAEVDCRKASKRASQQKWLQRPENRDYFRGPENVRRVQQWRRDHPGYARTSRCRRNTGSALQETLITQPTEITDENSPVTGLTLQDIITSQPTILIGLIAQLTGSALQDEIVETGRRLRQLGEDFLNSPHPEGGLYAPSSATRSGSEAPGSRPVQLDRPSPGS